MAVTKRIIMAQKCVFCGKDANKKNKEHVIPQWLIRYAGCEQAYIIDEEKRKIPLYALYCAGMYCL